MSNVPSSFSRRALKFLALSAIALALVGLGAQQWFVVLGGVMVALLLTAIRALVGEPSIGQPQVVQNPAENVGGRRAFVRETDHEVSSLAEEDSDLDLADLDVDPEDDLTPTERLHALLASELLTEGVVESVRELLAKGADPTEEDEYGHNALESAVLHGQESPVLQSLAESGVRISAESDILSSILSDKPRVEVVKFLLAHGSSANDPSECATSLLEQALTNDHVPDDVVFALLHSNPTFINNDDDEDWLTIAIQNDRSAAVLREILVVAEQCGSALDKSGALIVAMNNDMLESVAVLLSEGAPIFDYHENHDTTPIRLALETDDAEQVSLLALSCAGTDRYRLMGWAECSTDFSGMTNLYDYLACLEDLDKAWLNGYSQNETSFVDGVTGDALSQSLWKTVDLIEAQRLLLSGASPFWVPRSGELSAFDKACQRQNYHFISMALEALSDTEAQARLDGLKNAHGHHLATARALLGLRRRTREKVLALAALEK